MKKKNLIIYNNSKNILHIATYEVLFKNYFLDQIVFFFCFNLKD